MQSFNGNVKLGEKLKKVGEKWIFEPHHIKEFQEYDPPQIKRSANYLVMLQTGDNVLDYQDAQIRYRGAKMLVESGGDHSFINYENHAKYFFTKIKFYSVIAIGLKKMSLNDDQQKLPFITQTH